MTISSELKTVLFAAAITLIASGVASAGSLNIVNIGVLSEESDSADNSSGSNPSPAARHIFFDMALGRQFLGKGWSPYSNVTFVSVSTTVCPRSSWLWIDGSLTIAWSREGIDAETGAAAGPGDLFVDLRGGLGHWWNLTGSPLDCYAGAGLVYSRGDLELPDMSQPPLPFSQSLGHPVYPTIEESGNFWGGYLRGEFVIHPGDQWHVGVCGAATLTTARTLVGRSVSAGSANVGIVVGVDE